MRDLHCASKKAVKLLQELERYGVVEKITRGQGKLSLIYVKNFSTLLSKAQCNKANDIPIEKMFSNRLVNYLHSRYENLSDLIFVDEEALRTGCRLSTYYALKVLNKVNQYLLWVTLSRNT